MSTTWPVGSFEVEGEVASYGVSQGQWVRFDLKDGEALVNCFMPIWQLKEQLADGMKIAVTGTGRLYPKYGKFSLNVSAIRLSGEGSLKRAFEMLKKKLETEGLFDLARKRALPEFPKCVALITSEGAAAFTDFLRVSSLRWPATEIVHCNVGVQGDRAVGEVVAALEAAGQRPDLFDVIVVTRGGGSMEDLHVFNTEAVARAIFSSRVPVVSAIGHERDITIADFVADVRAATPSNAAEIIFPDAAEVRAKITQLATLSGRGIDAVLARQRGRVMEATHLADRWLGQLQRSVSTSTEKLTLQLHAYHDMIRAKIQLVASETRVLQSLHPQMLLKRGYSYSKAADGSVISRAAAIKSGQKITQVYFDGDVPFTAD